MQTTENQKKKKNTMERNKLCSHSVKIKTFKFHTIINDYCIKLSSFVMEKHESSL